MGRTRIYTEDTRVHVHASGDSKLQQHSDRRAIVNLIIENGGAMTMGAIDEHFGFCIRDKVAALIRAGWLSAEESV